MGRFAYQNTAVLSETDTYDNEMEVVFDSLSQNESFARIVIASFITQLNPTLEEISDVKTAVSEAVTNSIIHGYPKKKGNIVLHCAISGNEVLVEVTDYGKGIADVKQAMQMMFSDSPDSERSGMGFTFMNAFMDEVDVNSEVGKGTTVRMKKRIAAT